MSAQPRPGRILVIEAYTDANIGSGALVENTVRLLQEHYGGVAIRVMAHSPAAFADRYGLDCVQDVFEYPYQQSRLRQAVWLLRTAGWMLAVYLQALLRLPGGVWLCRKRVAQYLWADLIVSVGAERINDKFLKTSVFALYSCALIGKLGRPLVLFPCTIGPFLFRWSRWAAARVLRSPRLILTRDRRSEDLVRELVGPAAPRLICTADVAVMQPLIPREDALRKLGSDGSRMQVGISAMRWGYQLHERTTPFSNYRAYVREMAALADRLVEDFNVRVVFFPTNYPVHGSREDDVSACRDVQGEMRHAEASGLLAELPSPAELKGMLACSHVNITTRMHACILSTGAGVPTLSVNYLFKLREYMESVGLGEFSVDIEDFCADRVYPLFRRLWEERDRWHRHLVEAIGQKQEHLRQTLRHLPPLP